MKEVKSSRVYGWYKLTRTGTILFYFVHKQIDACNGYYCDGYKPNSFNKPTIWTEDWDGWYDLDIIIFLC